jgi:hypothetical protein
LKFELNPNSRSNLAIQFKRRLKFNLNSGLLENGVMPSAAAMPTDVLEYVAWLNVIISWLLSYHYLANVIP